MHESKDQPQSDEDFFAKLFEEGKEIHMSFKDIICNLFSSPRIAELEHEIVLLMSEATVFAEENVRLRKRLEQKDFPKLVRAAELSGHPDQFLTLVKAEALSEVAAKWHDSGLPDPVDPVESLLEEEAILLRGAGN